MSTFELVIVALALIYVVSSLYFSISGRILTERREKKEDERYEEHKAIDEQISVLTQRLGAITKENDRLNGVIRSWMDAAGKYKGMYETLLSEKEELQRGTEKLTESTTTKKRNTKKGGE